ncbi:hypothetical protein CWI38_2077p0020 [Hamiltosporidium tvaerminnensis]|uniref:EF-hand domain-containing protein n=2 Tax=Hamiltosporidium TaxID=1176354 RepID=A0A4Q9LDV8_9MICR|nr:hypothetical protein LUQ84_001296 [Hamiltosporidium tvaerminnensis]TBU02475.1 hypothetical protein CWI36_1105p0020 [Hamiltosporidium magnivora]TBU02581.1 hypothetical protein CWI37_0450p0010 [Hamiltosporidium tvaerminnensis]TBU03402.1 hypothetical protein CWI37_0300p0020 [Hamiltosporidium tvaerminnensis]TBU04970.1 hypothetical protein CWI39_0735p0010 [Hamiltosporidium magnivora]
MEDTVREKYNYFVSNQKLNKDTFKDLVRLCGYAPTEEQLNIDVPETFEEFEKLLVSFEKKYTKEDLYNELRALGDDEYISTDELRKLLTSGNDKLTEEEIRSFFRAVETNGNEVSIRDIVDLLYDA